MDEIEQTLEKVDSSVKTKHNSVIADDQSDEDNKLKLNTHFLVAQSQSNYLPTMVRSVKEILGSSDFNIEEQLVVVELVEEYLRRG